MTTAVRLDSSTILGRLRYKVTATRPTTAFVSASEIHEKLVTNRISSTHSSAVTPPTASTLCISMAP